jgi:hypothetical protein
MSVRSTRRREPEPELDSAGVPLDDYAGYPELAAASSLPVNADLTAALEAIDTSVLDAGGHIRLAQQWARVEAAAAGHKIAAIAAMAGPEPTIEQITEAHGVPDFTDYEVGAALCLGGRSAQKLTKAARALAHQMPHALAALRAGELSYLQALQYADAAENLTDEQCDRVQELTLEKAKTKTPWKLRELLRRTVIRVGAEDYAKRQQQAKKAVGVTTWYDDTTGMADFFAHMTAIDAKLVQAGIEHWARAAKASGDSRSLDELRVAGLVSIVEAYMTGDTSDGAAPRSHGRPLAVNLAWDLLSFLGLTDHPGEILGTGQLIPAEAMRDLIPDAEFRRIITDPMTGELLDYGRTTYRFPSDLTGYLVAKWVTSTGPGSTVPAENGDMDHGLPWDELGETNRDNGNPCNRRWHRAKTIGGWTVRQTDDGCWEWRSPHGLTTKTSPHDYRLGP